MEKERIASLVSNHEIKAFSLVFVLDSYKPGLAVTRLPELRETMKTFVHLLV